MLPEDVGELVAQSTRAGIVAQVATGAVPLRAVAAALSMDRKTVSYHAAVLARRGIVVVEYRGNVAWLRSPGTLAGCPCEVEFGEVQAERRHVEQAHRLGRPTYELTQRLEAAALGTPCSAHACDAAVGTYCGEILAGGPEKDEGWFHPVRVAAAYHRILAVAPMARWEEPSPAVVPAPDGKVVDALW